MTAEEKLAAILAAVQTDPGHRGLARDPVDNLFTATAGDYQSACRSLADSLSLSIYTGFLIPTSKPPSFETDGPLGTVFLWHTIRDLTGRNNCHIYSEKPVLRSIEAALFEIYGEGSKLEHWFISEHSLWIERGGPAADGKCYSMRGQEIALKSQVNSNVLGYANDQSYGGRTIGIGDGGNEIGMGKIPHETIVKNIPNGDLIHCRVPTDHLIVAGVSNWGAYALAAGIYVLRGVKPPSDLFDPDREREILEVMVKEGPLVDGMTGKQEATVDGLSWEEYVKPLIRIRQILES